MVEYIEIDGNGRVDYVEKYKQEFIEFMIDCSVLRFGDFVTKSGRKTPFFVNTGFYRTGSQLSRLGEYYAHAIREAFGLDADHAARDRFRHGKDVQIHRSRDHAPVVVVRVVAGDLGASADGVEGDVPVAVFREEGVRRGGIAFPLGRDGFRRDGESFGQGGVDPAGEDGVFQSGNVHGQVPFLYVQVVRTPQ